MNTLTDEMITLEFPDGNTRDVAKGTTGYDVAASISSSLAKKAVLIELDGELYDLKRPIDAGGKIRILDRKTPEALEVIRHDCAHVLAQAVQDLFPGTQVTIGPVIEDGFFYDFAREEPFQLEDLAKIEKKMKHIIDQDLPITREVWDRDDAIAHFKDMGEHYKAEIISDLPEDETISIYYQGEKGTDNSWHDLCRGPHLPSTRHIGKAFSLTKLAGAYWRGDHRNAMLQRIYGACFATEDDLAAYKKRIEEAEKRDHRKLGKQMDLFHIQDEARGQVFWHDKGWTIWLELENYIRRRVREDGYQEVKTPVLIDRVLWEKSGHWEKFQEHMFTCDVDGGALAMKPMNCPAHVQIFKQGLKSYRDLPLRMAEFGSCHRNEPSGALHGIMRVRGFVQDDAHIFCRDDQIEEETKRFITLLSRCYKDLGFSDWSVKFSDRPEVRAGADEVWDRAENALLAATKAAGIEPELNPGEGAFYGPKLEFVLKDAIGRDWQCGTFQLDFVVPERLGAEFVAEDSGKHTPVMIHRAILGSMERFIGILIEQYAGAFPLWLAPTQVVLATITSEADGYAQDVKTKLEAACLRVAMDLRNEKISYKVREHSLNKVPVIAAIGKNEAADGTLAIRRFGSQKQEVMPLDKVISTLTSEATPPDLKKH